MLWKRHLSICLSLVKYLIDWPNWSLIMGLHVMLYIFYCGIKLDGKVQNC